MKVIRGVFLALVAGICWGMSGTVGQYLFTEKNVDAGWLTVVRMLVSGVVLLLLALWSQPQNVRRIWNEKQAVARLLLFSLLGLMAVQFGYMQAIRYSNAGTATAIQYLGEAFILIFTCVSMKRYPKSFEVVGLILALTGIYLLATHGDVGNMVLSTQGLVWGLVAAVALMTYTLLPGKLIREYGNQTVTGYAMLIGGMVLMVALQSWNRDVSVDKEVFLAMLVIVVIGTILAFTAYFQSIADIGGVKAGLLASVETIAAPLFASLWLKTKFELVDYIGFACVLAMVILLAVPALREEAAKGQGGCEG